MSQYFKFVAILIAIMPFSCGKSGKPESTLNAIDQMNSKRELYLDLIKDQQDEDGFIYTDECDALLFAGLIAHAGAGVNILAARDNVSHEWFRTPSHDCYPKRSKSSISRDMLVGAMWGMYARGKYQELEELWDYGKNHNWIMGDGNVDVVMFTVNFINTLKALTDRNITGAEIWIDPGKDHQRHVVALNGLLRAEVLGKINPAALSVIKKFYQKSPRNALYSYIVHRYGDGNQAETLALLNDDNLFPRDRLPESKDRCTRWLWERDSKGDDWLACPDEGHVHSGGDLLFIAELLERSK